MIKALLILNSCENDKTAWSGTNYHIHQSLKQYFDIQYYQHVRNTKYLGRLVSYYFKFIKIFFNINREIEPYWYQSYVGRKTSTYAKKSDSQYIFTTNSFLVPFLSKTKKKIIYISDATFYAMINYYWFNYNKKDFYIFEKLQKLSLVKSHYNFLASNWAVESAVNHYGSNPNNTICIPFGANLPASQFNLKKLKVDSVHVLFCGVDKVRKGLQLAIDTVAELNKRHNDIFVLDVLGISGTNTPIINYHGKKDKNKLEDLSYIQKLYESSDLFLLPTKAECAGIVFCEAAMYSLPIITHNTGGVPTYVKHGYNGILLEIGSNASDFADAVDVIIQDQPSYQKYSLASRKLYEDSLSWDCWAKTVCQKLVEYDFKNN